MIRQFIKMLLMSTTRFFKIHIIIDELIKQKNINDCHSAVLSTAGIFHEQARVFNLQKNINSIKVGTQTHVRGELIVFPYGGTIDIGNYCYIGEGCRIWSGERISIGDFVGIAHNVNIMDFAHETNYCDRAEGFRAIFLKGHPKEKGHIPTAPVIIEDYVAIYPNASILRGVTIGKGAIVSTGSVVVNDVTPFTLVMGNPAKAIWKIPPEQRSQ